MEYYGYFRKPDWISYGCLNRFNNDILIRLHQKISYRFPWKGDVCLSLSEDLDRIKFDNNIYDFEFPLNDFIDLVLPMEIYFFKQRIIAQKQDSFFKKLEVITSNLTKDMLRSELSDLGIPEEDLV